MSAGRADFRHEHGEAADAEGRQAQTRAWAIRRGDFADRYVLFRDRGRRLCGGCGWGGLRLGRVRDAEVVVALALLGDEGIDDLRAEFGRVRTPIAVLPEHSDDDIWVAARCHADEPGVGSGPDAAAGTGQRSMAHDLGSASLADEVDSFQVGGVSRIEWPR